MIERMARRINGALEWAVTVLFICLIVLGGMQVFARFVLGKSLVWSEEMSKIMFFYIIYLGASVALWNNSFVSLDLLSQHFPAKVKRAVDILIWCLILLFLVIIFVLGGQITLKTVNQITPALELPQAVVYLIIPVGSLLMVVPALNILMGYTAKQKKEG